MQIRLAKAIAAAGIASRREAETLIESGRVSVDGEVIRTPVFFVDESNKICVDGKLIKNKSSNVRLWRFYKPTGYLTTKSDPNGRKTVYDLIKEKSERLIYIGRLDLNSEGLLLFTNNGALSRYFELPKNQIKRTYKVRVFGNISDKVLAKIRKGITVDGVKYGPIDIQILQSDKSNKWLQMTLHEGKNREIRKVLGALDIQVSRLIRISYGGFSLEGLKPGQLSEVPKNIVEKLAAKLTENVDQSTKKLTHCK